MARGFKRVLLKLSGESLAGSSGAGIDERAVDAVAAQLHAAIADGQQLAVVIGGGNLWRGARRSLERVTADRIGMLATVMNALALAAALNRRGRSARALCAFAAEGIVERYTRGRAVRLLQSGSVVVLGGGTGNPFFTTDTTAALRAAEIGADVILKATQVDGVYSDDPRTNPRARRYAALSYGEAIGRKLGVMDTAAFALASENHIPLIVFDVHRPGNLKKALAGGSVGTRVGF